MKPIAIEIGQLWFDTLRNCTLRIESLTTVPEVVAVCNRLTIREGFKEPKNAHDKYTTCTAALGFVLFAASLPREEAQKMVQDAVMGTFSDIARNIEIKIDATTQSESKGDS